MKIKQIIAFASRQQIFNRICEFFSNEVTPSKYVPTEEAETKMQIHFSDYMSQWHDILREVTIPKCCDIEGCGEKSWEIDESLLIPTIIGHTFYVAGELKFHGQEMKDRKFVEEAKNDIKRMRCVYEKYIDVTMTFTAFATCDEKELDEVYQYAESLRNISAKKITCPENGYYAVVVLIDYITTISPHAPRYAEHWNDWLKSVIADKKKNYYFPQKRVAMW